MTDNNNSPPAAASEAFPDFEEQLGTDRSVESDSNRIGSGLPVVPSTASSTSSLVTTSSSASSSASTATSAPPRRGRARTTTLVGAENPAEVPISASDHQLARLVNSINSTNRRASQGQENTRRRSHSTWASSVVATSYIPPYRSASATLASYNSTSTTPTQFNSSSTFTVEPRSTTPVQEEYEDEEEGQKTPRAGAPVDRVVDRADSSENVTAVRGLGLFVDSWAPESSTGTSVDPFAVPAKKGGLTSRASEKTKEGSAVAESSRPVVLPPASTTVDQHPPVQVPLDIDHLTNPRVLRVQLPDYTLITALVVMQGSGYSNYLDSPQTAPNPRLAPPSPSQNMHQNGMNGGGMGVAGGMIGFPTPAGHQSDLNYIMQMVEDLSAQLAQNQGLTAGIVEKMGKVRFKAQHLDLSNDELLALAASELEASDGNLEKDNSELRKALEKSIYEKKENWKLAIHGANILHDVLDKMHHFKSQHESDTLAWHKNYRKQLADEREENLRLRNQIDDMKAAASRANDSLRQMRQFVTDHDETNELRIENVSLRQQRRLWKRKALPLIPDDDSEWSDDDDLIDSEEKKRKAEEEIEKDRKAIEDGVIEASS